MTENQSAEAIWQQEATSYLEAQSEPPDEDELSWADEAAQDEFIDSYRNYLEGEEPF